jgi:hypothetical protein
MATTVMLRPTAVSSTVPTLHARERLGGVGIKIKRVLSEAAASRNSVGQYLLGEKEDGDKRDGAHPKKLLSLTANE